MLKEQLPDWLQDHFFLSNAIKENFFEWSKQIKNLWNDFLLLHPLKTNKEKKPFQTFYIRNDEKPWEKNNVVNMLDFDAIMGKIFF